MVMLITREQTRQIQVVSETVLYRQALDFFRAGVKTAQGKTVERTPLTNTQVNGLVNIVQASTYQELLDFVEHQYTRNMRDERVTQFYKDLKPVLEWLPTLAQQEGILTDGLPTLQADEEQQIVNLLLARELIQHLAAENMVKEAQAKIDKQQKRRKEQNHD
jgi:hypothetical protein